MFLEVQGCNFYFRPVQGFFRGLVFRGRVVGISRGAGWTTVQDMFG